MKPGPDTHLTSLVCTKTRYSFRSLRGSTPLTGIFISRPTSGPSHLPAQAHGDHTDLSSHHAFSTSPTIPLKTGPASRDGRGVCGRLKPRLVWFQAVSEAPRGVLMTPIHTFMVWSNSYYDPSYRGGGARQPTHPASAPSPEIRALHTIPGALLGGNVAGMDSTTSTSTDGNNHMCGRRQWKLRSRKTLDP